MSSIYFKIGELFKQKETDMVGDRTTQVNSDTTAKNNAITAINTDKTSKFDTLSADVNAAYVAKGALLLAKKNELASAINALLTNATAEVDSITELISYLNANNSDWVSTLSAKKTSLDDALAAHDLSLGDFAGFESAWGIIYTRSTAAIPSTDLTLHINMSESPREADGTYPEDGDAVTGYEGAVDVTNNGSPIRYYSIYQWGAGGNIVNVTSPFLDFTSNKLVTPGGLDFSSGEATVAFAMVDGRYDATTSAWLRFTDANQKGIQFQFEKSEHSSKIKCYFRLDGANTKYGFISDDYVITDTAMHTIVATADGDGNLTVKVDGASVAMSSMAVPNVGWTPHINGHFFLGDLAVHSSVLSGNDLDSLEAYYNFKYINFADSEVMFQSSNLANLHGRTIGNPPGENDTLNGYNNAQVYFDVRTEKMFKVGSRAEVKYISSGYIYNGPNHIFITDDLEWSSKNKGYGYHTSDMKDTSAGYLLRIAQNYLYVYYSDGVGTLSLVFNSGAITNSADDEISFIVEWDGTCKIAKNGTILNTLATKFTVDNYYAPFLWHQRTGTGAITMDGNLVDWAWPSNYSSEEASNATPVKVEGTGNVIVSGNHINNFANPMGKGGSVKIGTVQGEGSYVDWQPNIFHNNNRQHLTLSTTEDVFDYNDTNAEMSIRSHYLSTYNTFLKDGVLDHLHVRSNILGFTTWEDYYNDISNSYEGDTDINRMTIGRTRIQFYDDHVILWQNGYPLYRWEGIDTSQQYYFNWKSMDATWTPGLEDIKIYNS
jgi:hypothetical protein